MALEVDIGHRLGAFKLEARFASREGLTVLFGPSGAGKTLLIGAIAGLIRPDRGRIVLDGKTLLDTDRGVYVPRHQRRIGVVFQEGRLLPHLTVRQNLLFGRWFTAGVERFGDLTSVVDRLGIGHLLHRRPGFLSGGEKQRVAIGRALLASPRLLLMDEPLASLDEARKAEILPLVERLRDEFAVPIVYVSHSVAEVARLATTVVVLADGRVVSAGPAETVLSRPDLLPLGESGEAGSLLDAKIIEHEDAFDLSVLRSRAGDLRVPRIALPVGAPVRVRVRARDVLVALERPVGLSALNVFAGEVVAIDDLPGPLVAASLNCGGDVLVAHLTRKSVHELRLRPGTHVHAIVKGVAFDPSTLTGVPGQASRPSRRD